MLSMHTTPGIILALVPRDKENKDIKEIHYTQRCGLQPKGVSIEAVKYSTASSTLNMAMREEEEVRGRHGYGMEGTRGTRRRPRE